MNRFNGIIDRSSKSKKIFIFRIPHYGYSGMVAGFSFVSIRIRCGTVDGFQKKQKKKIKFRPSILRFRIPHSAFRMMLVRWKRNNESVSIRIDLMELFNWQNQRWKWKSSAFRIPDRRDRKRFEISNELHHFDLIPTD